jgi:hypothetical protein
MPGTGPRDDVGKTSDPEIASAEGLFRDEPVGKTAKPAGSAPPGTSAGGGEIFELADSPDAETEDAEPPIPAAPSVNPESVRPREATRPKAARAGESYPIDPESLVDVVWSRGAEWGPNLAIVGAWLLVFGLLLYFLVGSLPYGVSFLLLLIMAVGAIILSYPILITLERPVRITPEQAVRDYYGALSHHLPHYRRMWLLLARTGRICSSYGSFEGFKAYWNEKLQTIKGSKAGTWTPLVFEVENYRAEQSAGKSQVDAKLTLKISIRGQRQAGPVASIPGQISLVRGPDKMWYLENGTLPHAQRDKRPV